MDIFNLLNDIVLTLLVVPPTIFVLGVTLLGSAVEKSKQEEKAARESESSIIKEQIEEVEKSLKEVKKNGNTTDLYSNLEILKKKQKQTDDKIKKIKIKYNSINLLNTVIYPTIAFLIFLILNKFILNIYLLKFKILFFIFIICEIILILWGLFKIYRSLKLIEEISINKKESDYFDHLTESVKNALDQHEQELKEEVYIEFINKAFPLNVTCSSELNIDFRVKLKKGAILNDTEVWFFIPDGFELIKPDESESWRQPSDYIIPNIRTVKVVIGKISIGPYIEKKLKIKTPAIVGNYSIRYSIKGAGYNGTTQDLKLIVG